MSARRALARSAVALLVSACLLQGSGPASATEPVDTTEATTSVVVTARQRVRLEALPPIVHQGGLVAGADAARSALTAHVRPVRRGRRVELQVWHGSGWEPVSTVRQDARGRAQFAASASADGQPLTYRVRARAARGLPALTSTAVSTARWLSPTWTDEFSGSALSSVWNHRGQGYEGASRRRCSRGDPSAVTVGGGAVRLSVLEDPTRTTRCKAWVRGEVAGRFAYRLNGHIGTEGAFSFRYGVAAARVKFQRLRGQHGAFWMQPVGGMYPGSIGSEIDVVEYFGDHHPEGGLATFMHRYEGRRKVTAGGWIRDQASFLRNRSDRWWKSYHVFSVQWAPRSLVFRIDGKESVRIDRETSSVRQFPILSLLASDYEIPKIRERHLPQRMYVDWIRVWETGE